MISGNAVRIGPARSLTIRDLVVVSSDWRTIASHFPNLDGTNGTAGHAGQVGHGTTRHPTRKHVLDHTLTAVLRYKMIIKIY